MVKIDEKERLSELDSYEIIDTKAESAFDDITQLASDFFNVPICLVSLVDGKRQWFKSRVGLKAPETARDVSLCAQAIQQKDVMVLEDAKNHPDHKDNPLVKGDLNVGFYAGAPLITKTGHALGTLCLIDHEPRSFSDRERKSLRTLADQVMNLLELRKKNLELEKSLSKSLADVDIYKELVDKGKALLCVHNLQGEILQVNNTASQSLGYTKDEMLSLNLKNLMPEKHKDKFTTYLKTIATDLRHNGVFEVMTKNGETQFWSYSNVLIPSTGRIIGYSLDVTDSVLNKQKLKFQEYIIKEAQRLANFGIWSFDIVSGLVDWSDEVYEIFDIELGTKIDYQVYSSKIHPDDIERVNKTVQDSIENQSPYSIEHRLALKNDDVKYISATGRVITNSHGEVTKLIGSIQDVTKRVEHEKELIEAKETAEELGSLKQEFLANMSHEIRTPMSSIMGFARLLLSGKLPEKEYKYAELIYHAGENLLTIINDILDFSKMEAGKLTIESVAFNLQDILQQAHELHLERAKDKGLRLLLDVSKSVPKGMKGDSVRLSQILNNLLSNAIKFTNKGFVELSADVITTRKQDLLVLKIADSGIGIPADKVDKVFNSFEQGEGSITRKYGGTGLGLSITKTIVELMGGNIKVSSVDGEGTTFSVTIPLDAAKSIETNPENFDFNMPFNFSNYKILLAEDNPNNQLLASAYLTKVNAKVDMANDGLEALEYLNRENYDIILMDIQMPRMDGISCANTIRANAEWNHIPIVALTAHALKEEKQKMLDAGMNGYLSKPFKPAELYKAIREQLELFQKNSFKEESNESPENGELEKYDLEKLKLYALHDETLFKGLLNILLDSLPKSISGIESALKDEDTKTVKKLVHKLKPSIIMFGVAKSVVQIEKIELLPEKPTAQEWKVVAEFLKSLRELLDVVKSSN